MPKLPDAGNIKQSKIRSAESVEQSRTCQGARSSVSPAYPAVCAADTLSATGSIYDATVGFIVQASAHPGCATLLFFQIILIAAALMWNQANREQIEAEAKRLQMRIAKAIREDRWGKAKTLQRLLTRSHSGKMLAVKRATENRDKRTPGVDEKAWLTPAARWKGMLSLRHHGYRPIPLRRVYIIESMTASGTCSGGGQSADIPPKVHSGSSSGTSG